jgi:hypothetical protein
MCFQLQLISTDRKSFGQEMASGTFHVQHVQEAHRRSQVPPARRWSALRAMLLRTPQPQVPRLWGTYY